MPRKKKEKKFEDYTPEEIEKLKKDKKRLPKPDPPKLPEIKLRYNYIGHTKCTPERIDAAVELTKLGLTKEDVAKKLKVSRRRMYEWVVQGQELSEKIHSGELNEEDLTLTQQYYIYAYLQLEEAEAECIIERLQRIREAGQKGSWQADAWTLERLFPDKYSLQQRIVHSKEAKPIDVEQVKELISKVKNEIVEEKAIDVEYEVVDENKKEQEELEAILGKEEDN